jgi:hypothetical protein
VHIVPNYKSKSSSLKYRIGVTSCNIVKPSSNDLRGQSFTMWSIVCWRCPQSQLPESSKPQRFIRKAHLPCPVRERLIRTHSCSFSENPEGLVVGSLMICPWTGVDADQVFFQRPRIRKLSLVGPGSSIQIGFHERNWIFETFCSCSIKSVFL